MPARSRRRLRRPRYHRARATAQRSPCSAERASGTNSHIRSALKIGLRPTHCGPTPRRSVCAAVAGHTLSVSWGDTNPAGSLTFYLLRTGRPASVTPAVFGRELPGPHAGLRFHPSNRSEVHCHRRCPVHGLRLSRLRSHGRRTRVLSAVRQESQEILCQVLSSSASLNRVKF